MIATTEFTHIHTHTLSLCLSARVAEGLHTANALLLSRLGQHDLALAEYVYYLRDFKTAEEYCMKHYHPEREETREMFFTLLRVYTGQQHSSPNQSLSSSSSSSSSSSQSPMTSMSLGFDPSFQEQLRTATFDLLNRYATRLDCLKVHFFPFNENSSSRSLSHSHIRLKLLYLIYLIRFCAGDWVIKG